MTGKKRRLSRHDDRPGSALSLHHLWEAVPAAEEVDGDDPAFTDEMWTYYAHQIARESAQPAGIPDLSSPLGDVSTDEGQGPAL